MSSFKLGKMDSAVIFKKDGTVEGVIPKAEDDDDIPDSALVAAAIMTAFDKENPLLKQIVDEFVDEVSKVPVEGNA